MSCEYKIIDFHTHPFDGDNTNICNYVKNCKLTVDSTKKFFESLNVEKICGSVVSICENAYTNWEDVRQYNDKALKLSNYYNGFYVPGFHVHPAFVKESIAEIERMNKLNVKLVGELVPYIQRWNNFNYASKEFFEICEAIEHYDMVLSLHTMENDEMDSLVNRFKNLKIVAAHPGEKSSFLQHLNRMEKSENYYLDLSGTGLFRYGLLRKGIDEFSSKRFLFGSDYPVCNPAMYVGGVALDNILTDSEKRDILYNNAKELLKI